jgi:hypothetical protein
VEPLLWRARWTRPARGSLPGVACLGCPAGRDLPYGLVPGAPGPLVAM